MTGKDFVTKMVDALNSRDYQAFLALHDPDVTLATGAGLTFKGPQSAARFGWAVTRSIPRRTGDGWNRDLGRRLGMRRGDDGRQPDRAAARSYWAAAGSATDGEEGGN